MRRTSSRKAANTKAKLLKSIRPTERGVQMKLLEMLEQRTLFSNLPAPIAGAVTTISRIPGTSDPTDPFYFSQVNSDSSAQSVANSAAWKVACDSE